MRNLKNKLLEVRDVNDLVFALSEGIYNVPVALTTMKDVTDGTGSLMSFNCMFNQAILKDNCSILCLSSNDGFSEMQLNLNAIDRILSKISCDKQSIVMHLLLVNGADFLLMFYLAGIEELDEED